MPPEAVCVDIGQLSARKNAADIDAYVSGMFYRNQKMKGSDPSPFYCATGII